MTGHSIVRFSEHHRNGGYIATVDTPFTIKHCHVLYSLSDTAVQGGNAYHDLEQVIIAVQGSFEVELDNGFHTSRHHMADPCIGLYVAPMVWQTLLNFSSDALALILVSARCEEAARYSGYQEFVRAAQGRHTASGRDRAAPRPSSMLLGREP